MMNRFFSILLLSLISFGAFSQTNVEITTGASYANEVYYDLSSGNTSTTDRTNWDLAFATDAFNVSVLANNGAGVELYTYPNGTFMAWESIDTNGLSTWPQMYNSVEDLNDGAFLRNIDLNNDFDQGWGMYNPNSHIIEGDSLFILKTAAGNYKKLWIVAANPNAGENSWTFKYADLNGENEQTANIASNDYIDLNYVHYSIENNEIISKEPFSKDWHILFTRYFDYNIPYYVTGVQINSELVKIQQVDGVNQVAFEDFEEANFNTKLTQIGSDWKEFDMGTFTYLVDTNRVFFTKVFNETAIDSTYWKLYFTGFSGSTEGIYSFTQKSLTGGTGIKEVEGLALFEIFPNPANDKINLITDTEEQMTVYIHDISGKMVYKKTIERGFNQKAISIRNLKAGVYHLSIGSAKGMSSQKFIKQ